MNAKHGTGVCVAMRNEVRGGGLTGPGSPILDDVDAFPPFFR